jgi:hypothetical protein
MVPADGVIAAHLIPNGKSTPSVPRQLSKRIQQDGEPFKEPANFARVFIEDGGTWPNGYDWNPIALHDETEKSGPLRRVQAAE